MGCLWFTYRKMELSYWLVLGKKQHNRLVEQKAFIDAIRIKSADFRSRVLSCTSLM